MNTLSIDKLQQKKAQLERDLSRSGSFQSTKFWKPEKDVSRIRVMPCWTDQEPYAGQFWRDASQHWNVSSDQKGPVMCPKHTPDLNGNCPVCDLVEELKADKNNLEAQEFVKECRAKPVHFLSIIDLDDPVYTAQAVAEYKKSRPDGDVPFKAGASKLQVYACPKTVFDQILNFIIQNDNKDITSLTDGNDLSLERKAKGGKGNAKYTTYTVTPKFKSTACALSEGTQLLALDKVGFVMDEKAMNELLLSSGAATSLKKSLGSGSNDSEDDFPESYGKLPSGDSSSTMNAGSSDDLEEEMRRALGKS
jgi:hypothetical protein